MEAFVSRKKRKLSPEYSQPAAVQNLTGPDEDDSTDFKLAILASLHPKIEQQALLDILLAHDGSVKEASASLGSKETSLARPKSSASLGYQGSLANFNFISDTSKRLKWMPKKGKTTHLYNPEDVATHTPCSLYHNFLPATEANELLQELLKEGRTFESMPFKLFDNIVITPHTSSFYVQSVEEQTKQKTEYVYNGAFLTDVRRFTPKMCEISVKVAEAVNEAIAERIRTRYPGQCKLKYQSPERWDPNVAVVNQYDGGSETVGYHSDQPTYIGPRAVIGSLSLGVGREFRIRRIVPQECDTSQSKTTAGGKAQEDVTGDSSGQISIHLPHNSLLVMHAEMQEEWKHSIAPSATIDPHPMSGNKRINITYRNFKASLHPKYTPKCKCDVPTVLRVVQKKKENRGRYFWSCYAGNVPGKDGCTFFQWADFDDDGNPIWKKI